jgi:hypothetical protein
MRKQKGSGGVSFLGLLTILLIGLKMTGYITWSWWWVTLPLWGGVAGLLLFLLIVLLIGIIIEVLERRR